MSEFYDRQGRPLADVMDWARLNDDREYKRINQTTVGKLWVSTVWLGMDHSWGSGPPLIFETMIFARGSWTDVYMDRYATEVDARAGHAYAVQKYARDGRWRHGMVKHARDQERASRKWRLAVGVSV